MCAHVSLSPDDTQMIGEAREAGCGDGRRAVSPESSLPARDSCAKLVNNTIHLLLPSQPQLWAPSGGLMAGCRGEAGSRPRAQASTAFRNTSTQAAPVAQGSAPALRYHTHPRKVNRRTWVGPSAGFTHV